MTAKLEIVLMVAPYWKNAEDNDVVYAAFDAFITKSAALAQKLDMLHPFIYQNYAGQPQPVFASYGKENRARLREIKNRYDPAGILDRLQPGYHQI